MRQLRVRWIKSEWNETLEATGFFLLLAQSNKVVHAIFDRLDVPVEHRRVGLQTRGVHFTLQREPAFGVTFVGADHGACRLAKDLGAAAGTGVESGVDQFLNHFFVRHFVEVREVIEFDHRERLQVKLRVVAL